MSSRSSSLARALAGCLLFGACSGGVDGAPPVTLAPYTTVAAQRASMLEPEVDVERVRSRMQVLSVAASTGDGSLTAVDTESVAQPGPQESSDQLVADDGVVADYDPSFDLGPDVVIDFGGAKAPVDDAGEAPSPDPAEPPASGSSPPDEAGWAAVDRALENALIRPGNTAASVAVSINGEIVHRAAFGVRDPSTGDLTEPQDRFRIASISKPITAIVALGLVRDGAIGLDDPVGQLVADHVGAESVSASTARLTLRQLLTHRSGFGKFQSTFFGRGATDCADAARQGLASGAGGGGYVYSNMNYCVVGMAIEALTGLSYEAAVYESLLTPLGISGMRVAPTFDPGPDETQHVTTPGRNYMETLGGAGGWIATPSDLVTIFDALDTTTSGYKPLDARTVLEMIVPAGGQFGQRGYGLGLISYGGGRFGHTGTIESTHAMVLNRGDGVTWAITVAGQSPGESTDLERIMNVAFVAGGFVPG